MIFLFVLKKADMPPLATLLSWRSKWDQGGGVHDMILTLQEQDREEGNKDEKRAGEGVGGRWGALGSWKIDNRHWATIKKPLDLSKDPGGSWEAQEKMCMCVGSSQHMDHTPVPTSCWVPPLPIGPQLETAKESKTPPRISYLLF